MSSTIPGSARWVRIKTLFTAAAELPAMQREAFLGRECADDPSLLDEVRSLLDSHDRADAFLDPVSDEQRAAALGDSRAPGERVGPYRLLERIGAGGMGDVYKAVRDDAEYRAEVAIKLMRADLRGALAEQRFRTERQILAALDHRNIARLLDGGSTAEGLPYVVMELVAGEPIDQYCDARQLGTRERVALFLQVCAAVNYAHQRLVVHRDLKPGNILVTADGSAKLLDFGIAKLLDAQAGADTAPQTRTMLRPMTLEYASPEQVSGQPVTTASDVYSLGVVLYRLITGQSPYRSTTGEAARIAEILGDTSPTRPSIAGALTHPGIDGDLDHILLMALRKEPSSRYASVERFAADLRAYLDGLPVAARRGSIGYRTAKFARRNRVAIIAATLVLASLVVGLGVALREARVAQQQRAIAQRHFDNVRKLANTLVIDLYGSIVDVPGAIKARGIVTETALKYLEQLSQEAGHDPELVSELAGAYMRLGDIQGGENGRGGDDRKSALVSYGKAQALTENLLREKPGNALATLGLARSLMLQSRVLLFTKGPEAALAPAARSVALVETLRPGSVDAYSLVHIQISSYWSLGQALAPLSRMEEAMAANRKMRDAAVKYVADRPDDIEGLKLLRNTYNNYVIVIDSRETPQQYFERATEGLRKAVAVGELLVAREPTVREHVERLALMQGNLADTHFNVGNYAEAIRYYRLALPVIEIAARDPSDSMYNLAKGVMQAGLGGALARTGDFAAAAPLFDAAEQQMRRMLQTDAENINLRFVLAEAEIYRGIMFASMADKAEATARQSVRRQAIAALETGTARMRKVGETYALQGPEKAVLDDGIAALARTRAALGSTP